MAIELDKLPKWALPVGVGGLIGVGVLVTKRKAPTSTLPTTPIPVNHGPTGNTDNGDGTDTTASWLAQFGDTLSGLITDSNQQIAALIAAGQQSEEHSTEQLAALLTQNATTQHDQNAAFLQNLISLNSGTMDNITHLIQAQSTANQANQAGLMDLIEQLGETFTDELNQITEIVTTPPTTAVNNLIDILKNRFKQAFERVGKPFGTAVPNSDITTGTLPNAPYSQDKDFTYYDTTGEFVTGPFRQFLGTQGGARTWGRPISQVFKDLDGYDTQVFEHSIMKYVPGSNPNTYDIFAQQIF
jgi:hypothetical protein